MNIELTGLDSWRWPTFGKPTTMVCPDDIKRLLAFDGCLTVHDGKQGSEPTPYGEHPGAWKGNGWYDRKESVQLSYLGSKFSDTGLEPLPDEVIFITSSYATAYHRSLMCWSMQLQYKKDLNTIASQFGPPSTKQRPCMFCFSTYLPNVLQCLLDERYCNFQPRSCDRCSSVIPFREHYLFINSFTYCWQCVQDEIIKLRSLPMVYRYTVDSKTGVI